MPGGMDGNDGWNRMKLALFFSYGASLSAWAKNGSMERDCHLYRELVKRGHEVTFVSYGEKGDEARIPAAWGIRVLARPTGLSCFDYAWQIPWLYGRELAGMDLVKSHQNHGALAALWCARVLGKPYHARCGYLRSVFLARAGASWLPRMMAWGEEALSFHGAGLASVPSEGEVAHAARTYRVGRSKFQLAPNWIDTEVFRPDPAVRHPRKLSFVGRMHPQKQPLLFLELVGQLRDLGVEAVMIGEGELDRQVDAKIARDKLPVTRFRRLPNTAIVGHLQSSAVYVLPTRYEGGSPKTLLEAMACGLPVVSTTAFGAREACRDGVHGYQCDPLDSAAMLRALRSLLGDAALAARMGEESRRHIVRLYSVEAALRREEAIMKELVPA